MLLSEPNPFLPLPIHYKRPRNVLTSEGLCYSRAEMQIETTQDYATDSWFLNVFTGENREVNWWLCLLKA